MFRLILIFLLSAHFAHAAYNCEIVKDKNNLTEDFPAFCEMATIMKHQKLKDEDMNPMCDESLDWAKTECILNGYKTCTEVVRKKNLYREETRDFGTRWPFYGCLVVVRGSKQ
jgi:hypothetical protein